MERIDTREEENAFILDLIARTRAISRRRMARILGVFARREIEDCEAELWLLVCTKAPSLRTHENPDGWVYVAADHVAQACFRRCAKEENGAASPDGEPDDASGRGYLLEDRVINDLLYEEWEKGGYKERLLALLNKNERMLYDLRYREKLSFEEIAAVQMALSRLRKKIVSALYRC